MAVRSVATTPSPSVEVQRALARLTRVQVDGTNGLDVQRIAFAAGGHLRRLGTDLDSIAHEIEMSDRAEG